MKLRSGNRILRALHERGDASLRALSGGPRAFLFLVTLLAGVLRVAVALDVPDEFTDWPDSYHYLSIARNVAVEQRYSSSWQPSGYRFGDLGPTAYREPLYPLFLALSLRVFGESPRAIYLLQALLGMLVVPLVWSLARRLFPPGVALIAATLACIHPYLIFYCTFISTENLASVLVLVIVALALRIYDRVAREGHPPYGSLAGLGLVLGAGMLTRTVFVVVGFVTIAALGSWIATRTRSLGIGGRATAVLALSTALVVTPWIARNLGIWHTFVYQTNSGTNLMIGYNDLATGGFQETEVIRLDRSLKGQPLDEVERDRIFRRRALEWIQAHPVRSTVLFVKKIALFWNPMPGIVKGARRMLGLTWSTLFLGLALIGLASAPWRDARIRYLGAILASYVLVHSIAFAVTRYRVPLEGLLCVFAGSGWMWLARRLGLGVTDHGTPRAADPAQGAAS